MSPEQQTFVFIDEDQRNKYSKSTLSAINAQVAKHAHRSRQHVVKPKFRKTKSAPTSPPNVLEVTKGIDETTQSTLEPAAKAVTTSPPALPRRSSDDGSGALVRATSSTTLPALKPRRYTLSSSKASRELTRARDNVQQSTEDDEPDQLSDLFANLCRITKYPAYQAFPFFLNHEERRLAHYWFTEVLKDDFGMQLKLEDTFQGQLTQYPLAFQVPLRWIIAKAANTLHEKTGSQSLAVVYRSREQALARLQEIVSDMSTPTDEAVGSIVQSIIHNPESRWVHLRGLDAMIANRGGLDAVIRQAQITCAEHIFLQYTFAEFTIPTIEELEHLQTILFDALLAIQDQAQEYTRTVKQMECWASSVDLLDYSSSNGLQIWKYTQQRQQVFAESTATGQLIKQPYEPCKDSQSKAKHFGAMFQLCEFLIQYENIEEKSLFLRKLAEATATAATTDEVTTLPSIMPGTNIFLAGHVNRQVQEELGNDGYDAKGVPAARDGIAALKLFWLIPDTMRAKLHEYLQGWLLGYETKVLSPGDISAMSDRITQLWTEKQRQKQAEVDTMEFCAADAA